MPEAVQYDAICVLRFHGRLQLRQSQRQILLVVDDGTAANDASRRSRDLGIHQPLCGLRRAGQRRRLPQSDDRRPRLSAGLDRTLDWLQLRDGKKLLRFIISIFWLLVSQKLKKLYSEGPCPVRFNLSLALNGQVNSIKFLDVIHILHSNFCIDVRIVAV